MKVLQINSVSGIRSTGRICTDIADVLKENGHDCKIAYGRETVPEKYRDISYRIGSNLDVNIHALSARIFDNMGFCSKRATKKLIKWIDEYNPDLIQLHNIHGYYVNIEILFNYLKTLNKPIVWTLHDCWAFTGHCSHFDFVGCNKWKEEGCNNCPQKHRYPESLLLDSSKKNFEKKKQLFKGLKNLTIITPSEWLAGVTRESFLGEYEVKAIPNGIDLNTFCPTESDFRVRYDLGDKKIILGVASVWDDRKGLEDFIRLSELIDENTRIVLVGLSESQIENLPENIIGINRTNNTKELAEIYTAADVFVNPTYEDTYPTTNLEAISCGTPVITYITGGSPESVDSGNGFCVKKGDIKAIFESLKDIDGCKVDTKDRFDASKRYKEYTQLYKELLGE